MERVNIVVNICQQKSTANTMPVLLGRVGNRQVTVLRDTGCSGAVVNAQFVEKEQFIGKDGYMMMIDKTIRKGPSAIIMVATPFHTGDIQALSLPDSVYDLIIGNIPLARPADKPDPMWTVASCKAQKADNTKEDNTKEDNTKEDNTKEDNTKEDNKKKDNKKEDNKKEDNKKEDNKKMQELMNIIDIQHLVTSPYHPITANYIQELMNIMDKTFGDITLSSNYCQLYTGVNEHYGYKTFGDITISSNL